MSESNSVELKLTNIKNEYVSDIRRKEIKNLVSLLKKSKFHKQFECGGFTDLMFKNISYLSEYEPEVNKIFSDSSLLKYCNHYYSYFIASNLDRCINFVFHHTSSDLNLLSIFNQYRNRLNDVTFDSIELAADLKNKASYYFSIINNADIKDRNESKIIKAIMMFITHNVLHLLNGNYEYSYIEEKLNNLKDYVTTLLMYYLDGMLMHNISYNEYYIRYTDTFINSNSKFNQINLIKINIGDAVYNFGKQRINFQNVFEITLAYYSYLAKQDPYFEEVYQFYKKLILNNIDHESK